MSKIEENRARGLLPEMDYLNECFELNRETGKLYWKIRLRKHFGSDATWTRFNTTLAETEVGRLEERTGYMLAPIDGKAYRVQYLMWKMFHGVDTERILRHIDGDITNNHISNLEEIIPKVETKKKLREGKEKKVANELPSQEYLKECFDYNEETGILYKKVRPRHHFDSDVGMNISNSSTIKNKKVGTYSHGYIIVDLDGKRYGAHRIIWKWYYGTEPKETIDHINGIKDDNRIENLREATHLENSQNLVNLKKNNKSGYIGVCWHEKSGKWRATFSYEGKTMHLGLFDTAYEAHLVREAKAKELQGEFYVKKN